jgi:hypothetical protein
MRPGIHCKPFAANQAGCDTSLDHTLEYLTKDTGGALTVIIQPSPFTYRHRVRLSKIKHSCPPSKRLEPKPNSFIQKLVF